MTPSHVGRKKKSFNRESLHASTVEWKRPVFLVPHSCGGKMEALGSESVVVVLWEFLVSV